jgi:two-component system, OmpR family, KDP operon response regulator KdpE
MKVLIADDEKDVRDVVSTIITLHWADGEIFEAADGESAVESFYDHAPDLLILDVCMPRVTGLDALQRIRRVSDVPAILLSVRADELDKVRAFELGADDYLTKPFGNLELLARARALLRRTQMGSPTERLPAFEAGDLVMDFARREVRLRGRAVNLTPTEYTLLYQLVRNAGHIVPHQTLLKHVWGDAYACELDYLKVYIRRLREKIEPNAANPTYITTERGVGYRFRQSRP